MSVLSSLAQSIILSLVRPFARVTKNTAPVPQWNTMEVGPGLAWTDDPTNMRGILSIDTADALALPSPLSVGPGLTTYSFGAVQAALSNVIIATLPYPNNTDSTSYLWIKGNVALSNGTIVATYNAKSVTGVVNASGSIITYWPSGSSFISSETNTNQPYPWGGFQAGVSFAVTGASSSGGKIKLAIPNVSNLAPGMTVFVADVAGTVEANGPWVLDSVPDSTHVVLRGSTFTNAWTSGGTVTPEASYAFVGTTNALILVGTGLRPGPWTTSEAVVSNSALGSDFRQNAGNIYYCVTSGTTAAMGPGPTSPSNNITDGTAVWNFYGPTTLGVTINWSVPRFDVVS